jgi:hypothetical protein
MTNAFEPLVVALMAVVPIAMVALICAAGPVLDRVTDRRLARRAEVERVVSAYRPIRIAEWTGRGWAEVRPAVAW